MGHCQLYIYVRCALSVKMSNWMTLNYGFTIFTFICALDAHFMYKKERESVRFAKYTYLIGARANKCTTSCQWIAFDSMGFISTLQTILHWVRGDGAAIVIRSDSELFWVNRIAIR